MTKKRTGGPFGAPIVTSPAKRRRNEEMSDEGMHQELAKLRARLDAHPKRKGDAYWRCAPQRAKTLHQRVRADGPKQNEPKQNEPSQEEA